MATKDYTTPGAVFSLLTIVGEPFQSGKYREWHVLCRCECGSEKNIMCRNLLKGLSRSCGCRKGLPGVPRLKGRKHGHCAGGVSSRTYESWRAARSRCIDPSDDHYPDYGGRGIEMCARWLNAFDDFLVDMGERPEGMTLDRYPDVNGNYELGNCRWATPAQQANNRRNNVRIEFRGELKTVSQVAHDIGMEPGVLGNRLRKGWSLERATTEPVISR